LASLIHSVAYIIYEYLFNLSSSSVSSVTPLTMCGCMGVASGFCNMAWQIIYTLPRYNELVVQQIQLHQGSVSLIASAAFLLVIIGSVHALCFFYLINWIGSVSTAVSRCMQSVLVFVASHFAFCSVQRSQCFDFSKGLALALVVCGVIVYSLHDAKVGEKAKGVGDNDKNESTQQAEYEILSYHHDEGLLTHALQHESNHANERT
jgi:hypothetical protein